MNLMTKEFLEENLFKEFPELEAGKDAVYYTYLDPDSESDEDRLSEIYHDLALCLDPLIDDADFMEITSKVPANSELAIRLYRKAIILRFQNDNWFRKFYLYDWDEYIQRILYNIKANQESLSAGE